MPQSRVFPHPGSTRLWSIALGLGVAIPTLTMSLGGLVRGHSYVLIPGAGATDSPLLPSWPDDAGTIADIQSADLRVLFWLAAALGFLVVLVTLLNEATRLLIRGIAYRLPLAIRLGLGAGRRALLRPLARDSVPLVAVGTLVALPVAVGLTAAMLITWPTESSPTALYLALPAVWFAASLLIVAVLLLILLGQTTPRVLEGAFGLLGSGTRATASPLEVLSRSTLTVIQLCAATIVAGSAVMLLRALGPANSPPGQAFHAGDDTLMIQMDVDRSPAFSTDPTGTIARLSEDLHSYPEVGAISFTSQGVLLGLGEVRRATTLCRECFRGTMPRPINTGNARLHVVPSNFPHAVRIPEDEIRGTSELQPRQVLVNRAFAYHLFPNGEPLGKYLRIGQRPEEWFEVVGVIPNLMAPGIGSPGEPQPALYLAVEEYPEAIRSLIIRFDGDAEGFIPLVEESLRQHGIVPGWSGTVTRFLTEFREPLRWFAWLFGLLAVTVTTFGSIGISATMRFLAEQRRREIGVRMALGSTRRQIQRLIVLEGVRLAALGAYLGVIFLGGIARMIEVRFAGARLFDPTLYVGLPAGLLALAIATSWAAATGAADTQPAEAML